MVSDRYAFTLACRVGQEPNMPSIIGESIRSL